MIFSKISELASQIETGQKTPRPSAFPKPKFSNLKIYVLFIFHFLIFYHFYFCLCIKTIHIYISTSKIQVCKNFAARLRRAAGLLFVVSSYNPSFFRA